MAPQLQPQSAHPGHCLALTPTDTYQGMAPSPDQLRYRVLHGKNIYKIHLRLQKPGSLAELGFGQELVLAEVLGQRLSTVSTVFFSQKNRGTWKASVTEGFDCVPRIN